MQESRIKTKMKLNKYIFVLILYSVGLPAERDLTLG